MKRETWVCVAKKEENAFDDAKVIYKISVYLFDFRL